MHTSASQPKETFERHKADLGFGLLLKKYVVDVRQATPEMRTKAVNDTVPRVTPMFWSTLKTDFACRPWLLIRDLLNPFALLAGVVSSAMITLHGGTYLAHRTEGAIQQHAIRGAVGAAFVMALAFVAAGLWLRFGGIEGYTITSVIDPSALPYPLNKTVARSADAWWLNYAHQPLLWLLGGALLAAALVVRRQTLRAFVHDAEREPDGVGQRLEPPHAGFDALGHRDLHAADRLLYRVNDHTAY